MSKFNGIEYDEPLTDIEVITICPYCSKKFLNKQSYRNHIVRGYCSMCDIKTGKSLSEEIKISSNYLEKKRYMSKADEMFEELGYENIIDNDNYIQYEFEGIYMDNEIIFDLKGKTIKKEYSTGESQEINIQEIQAINEKCKELDWLQ